MPHAVVGACTNLAILKVTLFKLLIVLNNNDACMKFTMCIAYVNRQCWWVAPSLIISNVIAKINML